MRVVIIALAAICLSGAAAAQSFSTNGPHGSGRGPVTLRAGEPNALDRLATQLDLDEGQKAQLRAILDEQRAKMDEYLREQKASGQDPSIEQIGAMQAQFQKEGVDQLRSLLTQAQLSKLEQLLQAQGGRLLGPSSGMTVSADASNSICDSSGKCIAR